MTEEDRSMHVALRVDVTTRRDGDYYTGPADVLRHAKMWIEDGLSDRDDFAEVTVTEMPPPAPRVTLNDLVKDAFAERSTGCPSCSNGTHPAAPCKCGHDYHGHGHGGLGGRCLNCKCNGYQESQNYPRCGAWGGCPMPLGHNKGHIDSPSRHRAPSVELSEPDDPAAYALAQYIDSHPASTVMAACRYLGWKLTFDLQPDGISSSECTQCDDHGSCALHSEASLSTCSVCSGAVEWVDCPTGGWWAHWNHPTDGHDAQPSPGGCSAGLLSANATDRVEVCVVGNPRNPKATHRVHRTTLGEAWTPGEEV